jgi:hypothetical protein
MPNENLANILAYKFPDLVNGKDYQVVQDNEAEGPKIINWTAVEAEPTVEEVMAFEQEYLNWKNANEYKEKRRKAYLEKWPLEPQLEAHAEATELPPRTAKIDQMLTDFAQIKKNIPKP